MAFHTQAVPQLALAAAALFAGAAFVTPSAPRAPPTAAAPGLLSAQVNPATPTSAPTASAAALVAVAACGALLLAARRPAAAAAQPGARRVVQVAAFENELGVQDPVGFWDPLGFSADGNVTSFRRRRSVELKHGRISMLATMGYITPELTGKFPGYLSPSAGLKFADVPNGLAAISKVPALGWAQVLAYAGFVEISAGSDDWKTGTPGDFGFKVLTSSDPAEKRKKLSAEIANGRLAMAAIIGMFFQDGLTGSAWGDWSLYTASPLRAREPKAARQFFGGGGSTTSYKAFDPATEFGVQDPVGFWDPLGLAADKNEAAFKRRRSVEIKHGRIAMLATMGYITPEYYKFPGFLVPSQGLKFADVPNGLGALSKVPALGWVQLVFFGGIVEGAFGTGEYKTGNPGEFSWKVLTSSDPAEKARKLRAELANGRLAMVAIIGMFFQDGLTGSAWGSWDLYTASPLRAFENELGVQDPVGFWDPLGFTADGDLLSFKRRRHVELKHGRIAMLATMGYITPEITGKFPGYLSPSLGLKFSDIPNGLAAVTKVPALGWVQIFLYAAYTELTGPTTRAANREDYANITPGAYGFKVLTSSDPEVLKKKLSAEIANGRLAMAAILGMFFQDGLTGSAWGDWALYTASPLRAFENELGVQAPTGFWDPLGLSKDGDVLAFKRRRVSEIKHGRIAMLATMGYITVGLGLKFPGYLSPSLGLKFADIPNGLAAISKVPSLGWVQILAYALYCEASSLNFGYFDEAYTKLTPGDYGYKPPLLTTSDPVKRKQRLNSELANGRLAMVAIIGLFFQDGLTGSAYGSWALYTASPLRAFENELGVQDPVGFWDPLGFSADGNVTSFRRRRSVELKHGRISMLATMGYITPELTGKFPGYLSPSAGLKFADVPNGLAAISKVPALGWAQVLAYAGFVEISAGSDDWKTGTPGDFGFKVLTSSDPAEKRKKLSAEIANGRLAMAAIIGMFFQDGLTGSAWGDWSLYTASPLRAREPKVARDFFGGGGSTTSYKSFDPSTEFGVQDPVGFWDPLGLSADKNEASFKRRRSVEIKHGRIAMLAAIGYIVPYYYKWPGDLAPSLGLKFADVPNGLAALSKVPAIGWVQLVFFGGIVEGAFGTGEYKTGNPGEFSWKVLTSSDPAEKARKLRAELANGRLAMMAIIGMFFQDGLTGSAWGDWSLYTASPLRAFETELGVQAPTGFWDPLGFTKDGSVANFKRRRISEIKHGRIAMLATMGYITPEITGKFPGYLDPVSGLKFADVPNGLAAISKVPGVGWLQIILYALYCEATGGFGYNSDGQMSDPGNAGWKPPLLATTNPELRKKRLNSELANGRLAMVAIIGMFFQDGLTGSAWGSWSLYTDSPLRAEAASA